MKYFSFFTLILLILVSACSEDQPNKDSAKKKDQPNYEQKAKPNTAQKSTTSVRKPSSPEQLTQAKDIIKAATPDILAAIDAKKVFKMYCTACHGFTGDLNVNGATDLTTSTLPLEERVAQVYNGRGLMTPFKGLLKDAEIVAVGNYVESLRK